MMTFLTWLNKAEDKMESLEAISFVKKDLEKQLKEIQNFKNEVSRHSQEYENCKSTGDILLNATDTDKEGVRGDLQQTKERWEALNKGETSLENKKNHLN